MSQLGIWKGLLVFAVFITPAYFHFLFALLDFLQACFQKAICGFGLASATRVTRPSKQEARDERAHMTSL